MKKLAMASIMVMSIVGCSSTKPQTVTQLPPDVPAPVAKMEKREAEFMKSNGYVKIEFDESGNFYGLTSTGTAYIETNHVTSRENAYNIALMRAKRNVAEFLSNDVSSNKFSKTITKTLMKSDTNDNLKTSKKEGGGSDKTDDLDLLAEDGNSAETMSAEDRARGQRVATYVKEQMTDNTAALLRGLVISQRNVERDSNVVSVEVKVSKHSVAASHQLKAMMEGLR